MYIYILFPSFFLFLACHKMIIEMKGEQSDFVYARTIKSHVLSFSGRSISATREIYNLINPNSFLWRTINWNRRLYSKLTWVCS